MELQKLAQEEYWFTAAACRSNLTDHELPGGMSHFVSIVMRTFYGEVHDFSKTGAVLLANDDGSEVRIVLKHRISVADYKGHAEVLDGMGVSALKACPSCRAIVSHDKSDLKIFGAGIAPINSTKPEDLRHNCPTYNGSMHMHGFMHMGHLRLNPHRSGDSTPTIPCEHWL